MARQSPPPGNRAKATQSQTVIVCDTNVLIFDALGGKPLSAAVLRALNRATQAAEVACSDISLWEMGQLIANGRIRVKAEPREAIELMLSKRNVRILPIDADIAVTAAGLLSGRTDPFDRIIAATALVHRATLISADDRLHGIPGLKTIW